MTHRVSRRGVVPATRRKTNGVYEFDTDEKKVLRPIDIDVWESLYVCRLCNGWCRNVQMFVRHLRIAHDIGYKTYVVKFRFGGRWPECSTPGCPQQACHGISLYVERPLRCVTCERLRFGPKGTITAASRAVNKWLHLRKVEPLNTSLERVQRRLDVLDDVFAAGMLTDVELKAYRTYLNETLDKLAKKRARDADDSARYDAMLALISSNEKKKKKKKNIDDVAVEADELPISSASTLGFNSEKELWEMAQRHASPSSRRSTKKKMKKKP